MSIDFEMVGKMWGSRQSWDALRKRVKDGFPIYVLQIHYPNSSSKFCAVHRTKADAMADMRNLRKHGVDCPISIMKKEK